MAEPVALSRVAKTFRRGPDLLPVLNGVDLQISTGEFVAILGPSGCGKSTLLRLIAGLDQPTTGAVTLADKVVTEADPRCAVVFQEPRLFPWKSVAANVAVGARRVRGSGSGVRGSKESGSANSEPRTLNPERWLDRVGLAGFGGSFPHQLSGGMAQRAALARALIGHPGVLLLDEPFAALDAFTRMQMQDLLADVCAEIRPTVVMVTHDVDEALHLADRIVLMSHRPSTIVSTVTIDQPRPRQRGDLALALLRGRILSHFGFTKPAAAD